MLLAPEATLGDGRYRLEGRRGFGGMATVWQAFDERLERPVAVKVLADTLALEPDFVRRFRREAQVAARLSHPNLVRLYDFGTERGRPFLVSEWIDGPDLHELSRDGGHIYGGELAVALLGVLDYIHGEGVVHRDVKPSNVLVDDDGRPRLTDFGIAQPTDATRLTQTGMVLGTAPFVAPEVIAGDPSTPRSDLYSAGRLLRYQLGEEIPARVERLADWLCREDPALRPATAAQALESLHGSSLHGNGLPPLPVTDAARTTPVPEREPTKPMLWIGATLAALALAAFALLATGDEGDGGRTTENPAVAVEAAATGSEESAAAGPAAPAPDAAAPSAYSIPAPKPKPKPDKGAELNQQGFSLLGAGEPEKAVKVLERAVSEFPTGSSDLNYAYALFNLGQALRLAGRPADAVPVLEQRLQIPNQTETVAQELELARQQAGL